jgi:hypothetical protein
LGADDPITTDWFGLQYCALMRVSPLL